MKKLTAIVCLLALVLALTACAGAFYTHLCAVKTNVCRTPYLS